jgi:hypothetical protein
VINSSLAIPTMACRSRQPDGDADLPPNRPQLVGRDCRARRPKARRRGGRDAVGQRVAALRATVPGRRVDGERQVGDRQPPVLRERDQDDVRVRRVEQALVLHHDGRAQLVRLLRQRVPPVGDHDLARGEAGHTYWPSVRGVPHAS